MAGFSDIIGTLRTTYRIGKAKFDSAGLTALRTLTLPDFAGMLMLDSNFVDVRKRRCVAFMDFESSGTSPLGTSTSGTGSSASVEAIIEDANQIGIRQIETGTTTTGRAAVMSAPGLLRLGQGVAVFEGSFKVPTLSDSGQRFVVRLGFLDSDQADATDGAYIEYDEAASANWQVCCANNATRAKNGTGTAVNTNWHTWKVVANAAGTSVSFFMDGTEVSGSPITTNIPTGSGRETGFGFHIIKSAGTTERTFVSDWIAWDFSLTTPRT